MGFAKDIAATCGLNICTKNTFIHLESERCSGFERHRSCPTVPSCVAAEPDALALLCISQANDSSGRTRSPVAAVRQTTTTPVAEQDRRTTVILKNIPDNYLREEFVQLLVREGFESLDFVYMPQKFGRERKFGYCIVNFPTSTDALLCWQHFTGFSNWTIPSDRICHLDWSDVQGDCALIERYRNSPLMNQYVADDMKPAVYRSGLRERFPAPTKPLKRFRVTRHPVAA